MLSYANNEGNFTLIFEALPNNLVICIDDRDNNNIHLLSQLQILDCYSIDCSDNWKLNQKPIDFITGECINNLELSTQHIPESTQYIPAQYIPESTQYIPESTQYVLESTQHILESTQHIPESTQHILESTQHIPESTQNILESTQNIP